MKEKRRRELLEFEIMLDESNREIELALKQGGIITKEDYERNVYYKQRVFEIKRSF